MISSIIGAFVALFVFTFFYPQDTKQIVVEKPKSITSPVVFNKAVTRQTDFTTAADRTVHAVVHVKNTSVKSYRDPLSLFILGGRGVREYEQVGTGSGVIISSDGYIVTNNHVIEGANAIQITLNDKRVYPAKLIATDVNSDIALLKIEAENLEFLPFADSDAIQVGEWVLAVGNPYNLTSTVTAGIVSAKGRNLQGNFSADSFIQTDAAVNPGNSGGALVNTKGELIGINTAISSQTGSFVGYSFAVPSNIARKIISDFLEFGAVQKVLLGIRPEADNEDVINGVKISEVTEDGNAKKSGLQSGDIIIGMDGVKIQNFSNLKGFLNSKKPGDIVAVEVDRSGEKIIKNVALKKDDTVVLRQLGLIVRELPSEDALEYGVDGGVQIVEIGNDYLEGYGVKRGYVITRINDDSVKTVSDLESALAKVNRRKALFIEMYDENRELQKFIFN